MASLVQRLTDVLGQAFDWWRAELWELVPANVRRIVRPVRQRPAVEVDGRVLILFADSGTGIQEIGRIDLDGTPPGAARHDMVERLLPARYQDHVHVDVRLPATSVLHKVLDLPAALSENLRQAVAFDLDRQTPFDPSQVYFDVRVRTHDRANRRLLVDLVVVAREVLDSIVETVRASGLRPVAARVAWPDGDGPGVNLLPNSEGPRAPRFVRPLSIALAGLAAVLAIAAVQVPLYRQQIQLEALTEDVQLARRQSEVGRRLNEDIDRLTRQGRFIVDRKLTQPLLTEVLDELTRLLPDDTWLFRVRIFGDDAQIFGHSTSATALIGVIEQSGLFEDVQFRAPLTRDTRLDAERFHIGFRIKREPQA